MEGWVGLGLASKQSTAVAASDDEDDCVYRVDVASARQSSEGGVSLLRGGTEREPGGTQASLQNVEARP